MINMDNRFDHLYFLKTKNGEIDRLKQLCLDYSINDNGIFDKAASFHIAWGIGPNGLIYISPTTFLIHKPDFNSTMELEACLEKYNTMN